MFRVVLLIALYNICLGVSVDKPSANSSDTNSGFLLKKDILIEPVIMNGTVPRNPEPMQPVILNGTVPRKPEPIQPVILNGTALRNTESNQSNVNQAITTEFPIQLNPLHKIPSLINTSASNESSNTKAELQTKNSDNKTASTNNASTSTIIDVKTTADSEWVPVETTEPSPYSDDVPKISEPETTLEEISVSSSNPTVIQDRTTEPVLTSTGASKNNDTHNITITLPQKFTPITPIDSTSTVLSSTTDADNPVVSTSSISQTGKPGSTAAITNSTEIDVTDIYSSITASESEGVTETPSPSTPDINVSSNTEPSSKSTESNQSSSDKPITSSPGTEGSTSLPDGTESSAKPSSQTQSTVKAHSSSVAPVDATTPPEKEKTSPTSETKDNTKVSSPPTISFTDDVTSTSFESTTVHITTIRKQSLTTLKLALGITFLVISLIAMAVLLGYLLKMKKRTVSYEELSLYP